jgi:hypothetical protein
LLLLLLDVRDVRCVRAPLLRSVAATDPSHHSLSSSLDARRRPLRLAVSSLVRDDATLAVRHVLQLRVLRSLRSLRWLRWLRWVRCVWLVWFVVPEIMLMLSSGRMASGSAYNSPSGAP